MGSRSAAGPVLVIQAHPDDADISSGASVARWTREGRTVTYVACTSGEAGQSDPPVSPEELGVLRERELNEAAATLGVAEVVFLRRPDGELRDTPALRGEIVDLIARVRPVDVVTHDPVSERDGHPDHWNAGLAALGAVVGAADQGHRVARVLLFRTGQPDMAVDVADTMDAKLAAVASHRTQRSMGEAPADAILKWARTAGARWGVPMAETFRSLTLAECRALLDATA